MELSKKISKDQIKELAATYGIEARVLDAVIKVECSGAGFEKNGDLKIQFEPSYFFEYTGRTIPNGVSGPKKEWEAYYAAKEIDWKAALMSTSWGMGQIMGRYYELAGYDSVQNMINDFKTGEYAQVKGMLVFCKNGGLLKYLKMKNFDAFAKKYNGPKYLKFDYVNRLIREYTNSKI